MSGERYSGTIEPFEYNHFNTLEFNKILPQKANQNQLKNILWFSLKGLG